MSAPSRAAAPWSVLVATLTVALVGSTGLCAWRLNQALGTAATSPPSTTAAAPPKPVLPANSQQARAQVTARAKVISEKLLSYTPADVDAQLDEALKLTTGAFHASYAKLIHDIVIPGAKAKNITTSATVVGVGVEALSSDTASLVVFIDQTTTTPPDAPKTSASTVREGLQHVDGEWLVNKFDPI
jgi:hypothetical protein